jgi:hypothetical protein
VKIDLSNQSLILRGESPEADRRFERALRLNGSDHPGPFTLPTPSALGKSVSAAALVQALKPGAAIEAVGNDIPIAARAAPRRGSGCWRELYRMVTEADHSPLKGDKLNVTA